MDVDLKALSRSALEQACALMQASSRDALRQMEATTVELNSRDARILELETQIEQLTKALYGKKSEKQRPQGDPGQLFFLNAAVIVVEEDTVSPDEAAQDREEDKQLIQYERKRRRARHAHKELPERVVVLEPSPEDRVGPEGQPMVINGYSTSRKIHYVPERLEWLVIKSPIMALAETKEYSHVVKPPPCLIPRGKATDDFMLAVTLRKFGLGIPLYR